MNENYHSERFPSCMNESTCVHMPPWRLGLIVPIGNFSHLRMYILYFQLQCNYAP